MKSTSLRVSNFLLGAEALVSFGPLTLLWLAMLFNLDRVVFDARVIVGALFTTLAVVSLLLVSRFLILRKPLHYVMHMILAGGFGAFGLLLLASHNNVHASRGDWRLGLLYSVLPLLCSLHLAYHARLTSGLRE